MIYNDIIETLKSIKSRPNIYIRKYPCYEIATSFIDGYLTAWAYKYNLEEKNNKSFWLDINTWYSEKLNKNFKDSLPDIVKEQYSGLSEDKLINKYLNVLIEFFNYKLENK